MRKQALSILMWLVISAAFVGPGTVTTAASAGAQYGYQLLWALLFSTLACILLQEGSARASIVSGKSLGGLIAEKYAGTKGIKVAWALVAAVIFGCIAYEAGNILGAIAGLSLAVNLDSRLMTFIIGLLSGLLLFKGNIKTVTNTLGVIVALMGIGFMIMAFRVTSSVDLVLEGLVIPVLPEGSALIALGLVGTTIVPYNLFLGSGISKGQDIKMMRWGLIVAVLIGGLISMAVLLTAIPINGSFSFEIMAKTMQESLGVFGKYLFIFGLFAAGFTSAVTAPLASAISVDSLQKDLGYSKDIRQKWFRRIWGLVLIAGLIFGMLEIKPVPAIILAQAVNGLLLPFLAIALWLMLNDKNLLGRKGTNGMVLNACYFFVVVVTCLLGFLNLSMAFGKTFGIEIKTYDILPFLLSLGLMIALIVSVKIRADLKNQI